MRVWCEDGDRGRGGWRGEVVVEGERGVRWSGGSKSESRGLGPVFEGEGGSKESGSRGR